VNAHRVSDVRQLETHTTEPLVLDPSEIEMAVAKLKKYKSPGDDQIPAEMFHGGCKTLWSEIHKLINSIWNKKEFPDQWKESIIVQIDEKGNKSDCIDYRAISLLSTTHKTVSSILPSRLSPYR
jgi:hypothetical protein